MTTHSDTTGEQKQIKPVKKKSTHLLITLIGFLLILKLSREKNTTKRTFCFFKNTHLHHLYQLEFILRSENWESRKKERKL